jgi:integrase
MSDPTAPAAERAKARRTRGAGSIYPTQSGLYRGSFAVVDPITHKRTRRYVSGHTPGEAERNLRKAITDSHRETAAAASPTLRWWADRWLDTIRHRVRPATHRSYGEAMRNHVLPDFGEWQLAAIGPGDVERWTARLSTRGLALSTVALARRVLAVCLADAERDGRVHRNAAHLARAPRVAGTTRRRTLTAAEARALLDVARDDPDAGLLVILALGTGARVGEILAIDWSAVDLNAGTIEIRGSLSRAGLGPPKSAKGTRTVALPPFALEALRAEDRRSGFVIAGRDGGPLYPDRASERWRTLRKRAGLPGLRFHDLRGTVATLALAAGTPPAAVADVLGHDVATLSRHYAGAIESGRDRVAAALSAALTDGGES